MAAAVEVAVAAISEKVAPPVAEVVQRATAARAAVRAASEDKAAVGKERCKRTRN